MKRNTWRKNSDEVIIEIKDSPTRKKNYWNLRGDERGYSYSHGDNSNASENLKDDVNIEISLNEGRTLTEEQKKNILETIIQGSEEFEQNTVEDSLIPESGEKSENKENSLVRRSREEPDYHGLNSSYSRWNTLLLLLILIGVIVLITTTGKF